MKILYIGKNTHLLEYLQFYLNEVTFDYCDSLWDSVSQLKNISYSLIIINISDCKEWHTLLARLKQQMHMPVVILSKNFNNSEKALAYRLGADDYITDIKELINLTDRIVRNKRKAVPTENRMGFKKFVVDVRQKTIYKDGIYIKLSDSEFELFYLLFSHRGKLLSHRQISNHLYGDTLKIEYGKCQSQIHSLRKKLEEYGAEDLINTTVDSGYSLNENDLFFCV